MNADRAKTDDDESGESGVWRPGARAITANEFPPHASDQVEFAIHFWAGWNAVDRRFDESLKPVETRLSGWIEIYSCDVDDPQNEKFVETLKIATVPTLCVFRGAEVVHRIIGDREEKPLLREIMVGVTSEEQKRPRWRFW